MDLTTQKCVPCEGGTNPMSSDEVKTYLTYLKSNWKNEDNKKLEREFTFKDFKEAMIFVNCK